MDIIEIEDKRPKIGLYLFIGSIIIAIMGIFALLEGIRLFSKQSYEAGIGFIGGITFFLMSYLCFFFGNIYRAYRNLRLTDRGFQYIFKDKLKEEFSWNEIDKIEIRGGSQCKIYIEGPGKRYITHYFPGTDINIKNVKSMLQEIRKYQPQYKFKIETEGL